MCLLGLGTAVRPHGERKGAEQDEGGEARGTSPGWAWGLQSRFRCSSKHDEKLLGGYEQETVMIKIWGYMCVCFFVLKGLY